MLVTAQKFQSQWGCRENCGHGATIERHSLSQPFGLPAPSEREPGCGLYHSMCRSETATLRAIFIAPTKLRSFYISPFIGGHSLSQLRCQLPQRGSRERAAPFNVPPKNRNVAGDFHRPYETLMILDFPIHRTTLPQSALRAASSLREGAGNGLYHSTCRPETATLRAIFIAPTKAQKFLHFTIHQTHTFFQNGRRNSYESC